MKPKRVPTIKVLRAARKIVANEGTWTSGVFAKDAANVTIACTDPLAARWCAVGAVQVSRHRFGLPNWEDADPLLCALDRIAQLEYGNNANLACVNDDIGRDAVLGIFDIAIRELGYEP